MNDGTGRITFANHPLVRLLGGSALLGVGCILVLHYGWLDYLLLRATEGRPYDPPGTPLDWAAVRMPFLVAAGVGGIGGGYLGRSGGWLSGLVGALICFLLPYAHFTLAGANLTFLIVRPELADGTALGLVLAMFLGWLGQTLAGAGGQTRAPEAAAGQRRGLGG